MSRVFEALRRSEQDRAAFAFVQPVPALPITPLPVEVGPQTTPNWNAVERLDPVLLPQTRLVTWRDKNSLGAEKFHVLATRLLHGRADHGPRKLLITSSSPEEGKSLVSANLGVALASLPQQRVLMIEGDLRKPALMRTLGLGHRRGVVEHVESGDPISRCMYRVGDMDLWILPTGGKTDKPLDVLQSTKLAETVRDLTNFFTWILIDSPPLMPMADANVWARCAEGIVLVVREGKTSKDELKQGLAGLDNKNVVAVVLNACTRTARKYQYYYGH